MAKRKDIGFVFMTNMSRLGFLISIPLILLVTMGIWLDKILNTGHVMLFSGIALSLITTAIGIKYTVTKLKNN